ncbi:MAG TPA: hypothetical protein VKZ60_03530 [Chloroflexota bacterium]|jgi:hypothetical protein|nr:hypothetical protein [Chloroflexota bacterium]
MATFWRIGARVFFGSWIVLLLIVLFQVGLALGGQRPFDPGHDLQFLLLPLLTAPGFLVVWASQRQQAR